MLNKNMERIVTDAVYKTALERIEKLLPIYYSYTICDFPNPNI
jgi:hypothetical protein